MFTYALLAMAAVSGPCDPGPSDAQIDALESQAFGAMKVAAEKVNAAARTGAVGSAGDAEWATYKSLRAQAEQLRLKRLEAAAACHAAPASSAVASVATSPSPTDPALTAPAPLAAAPPATRERRFAFSLSGGGATYDEGAPIKLPVITETGGVRGTYLLPIGSPPPTAPTSQVINQSTIAPSTTVNPQGAALDAHAWSNEVNLALVYAPAGQDRAGWRFGARLGLQDLTLKQSLPGPLSGAPQYSNFTAVYLYRSCVPPLSLNRCYDFYDGASTYTRQFFEVPGGPAQTVNSYVVREQQQRSDGELSVRRQTAIDTPLGRLDASFGGGLAGVWYDIKEDSQIALTKRDVTTITNLAFQRRASGPGFRASLDLAVAGRVPVSLPLRWSLSTSAGLENVSLTVQDGNHASTLSKQHQVVSAFGAGLTYDLSEALRADLTVRRRDDFIVLFAPPAGGGTSLPDGSAVDLYSMTSVLYNLGLSYRF
jgi:hypothetical protein